MDKTNKTDVRATCLNCIDGRVQLPVINWIRKQYDVDFVDVITEAGMDGVLAAQDNIDEILRSVKISVNMNKSGRIFVVGHHDCRGNPIEEAAHRRQITKAVDRLKAYWPKLAIMGLWVNSRWEVEVCDG